MSEVVGVVGMAAFLTAALVCDILLSYIRSRVIQKQHARFEVTKRDRSG
jgi:hypothetical protein